MTAGEAVRELFAQVPAPGKDVVWLADRLLEVAQHAGSVTLERLRTDGTHALVCRTEVDRPLSPGPDSLRFFRPLLARFAVIGAEEAGGAPQLYGGAYSLLRSSRTGPVRLEIAFENTPSSQHVTITRVPAAAPRPVESLPTDAAASAPAQPSA